MSRPFAIRRASAVLALVLSASLLGPQSPPAVTVLMAAPQRVPSAPDVNGVLFEEAVHQQLRESVKGYAFAIVDRDGKVVARAAGGWAQDPDDGNLRMSTTVPSLIGSVTKVMSGAALLHQFERRMLANASVAEQLDMHMLDKLPPKWRAQWRGRNLERITYRHLLQHRSGFRDGGCGGKNLDPLDQMSAGVRIEDIGTLDCYNNHNYYLLRYLIPSIAYPRETTAIHEEYEDLDLEAYTERVNVKYSLLFERYLREQVLARSEKPINAYCRPGKELPEGSVAKGYLNRTAREGAFSRTRESHEAVGDYCASQGSWYVSAEHLALFGRTLLYTDQWLKLGTRRMLFDPANPGEQFPWSGTVTHEGLASDGQTQWPMHGGAQGSAISGGTLVYQAALVQLPYGHVGAAVVNSPGRTSRQLGQALIDAFFAATRNVPVSRARHRLTLTAYQQFVTEMDEAGARIDWVDFYNAGTQVFANVVARPAGGAKNYVRHGLSGDEFQREYDRLVKAGKMTLRLIDSYVDRGQVRYAFVMSPDVAGSVPAYHLADAATHKKLFDDYTGRGLAPMSVSVVSVNGERRFSATWARAGRGALHVRSTLNGREYQALASEMARRNMELVYLNTYVHQGEIQYSVVFAEHGDRDQVWRHGLTSAEYQAAFDEWTAKGYGLRLVAGAGDGAVHRFAAVWQREATRASAARR